MITNRKARRREQALLRNSRAATQKGRLIRASAAALALTYGVVDLTQVTPAQAAPVAPPGCALDTTTPGLVVVTCATVPDTTNNGEHGVDIYNGFYGNDDIDLTNTGAFSTSGTSAFGISVVRRGYAGKYAAPESGGGISITNSGDIATSANGSIGINAESTGGYGYKYNATAGGGITITNSALIETVGQNADAISAKSTGGIGSYGKYTGFAGGAGGPITITNSGSLVTRGFYANGITAESRGGNGGESYSVTGGAGAAGGNITISNTGQIQTGGLAAHGIHITSTGGRGGNGTSKYYGGKYGPYGGDGGNGGNGGNITISNAGSIIVTASGSHGIFARSSGGDGGLGDGAFGRANGAAGAAGNVTIDNLAGGVIQGGTVDGIGVYVSGGNTVMLNNAGTLSALSGTAAKLVGNDVTLNNTGTLNGNVFLDGALSEALNNNGGGIFNSGPMVELKNGGLFTNAGTLSPGGTGTVQTTALTGNFTQTAAGRFKVDADWATPQSDRLDVSGTANLAGTVVVSPIAFPLSSDPANTGMTRTFTILTAAGGITDNGIAAEDTAAVDYELEKPDANTLDVTATVNFLPGGSGGQQLMVNGFNQNQINVGTALNQMFSNGNTLPFMMNLMQMPTMSGLGKGLTQLGPLGDGGNFGSALINGATFGSHLLSCRVNGAGTANAIISEGQCLWARAEASKFTNDGADTGASYDDNSTFFSAGMQFNLGGPWRMGGGIGYASSDLQTSSNASAEGDQLHLGGIIKYNPGPLLLAASLTGGHGWYDGMRDVAFGTFAQRARSDFETSFLTGRFTAAYLIERGRFYLKPQVDLAVSHLERDAYAEQAGGGIALRVAENDETVFTVAPFIELGTQIPIWQGAVARPYVRGGIRWQSEDEFGTSASFAAVPGSDFTVLSEVDELVGTFTAGVDLVGESDMSLRLRYDGAYGDITRRHTGSVKFSVPF